MRENFRIYVQISGPNSNFRTFQDKFQNFRTTPRPESIRTHSYSALHRKQIRGAGRIRDRRNVAQLSEVFLDWTCLLITATVKTVETITQRNNRTETLTCRPKAFSMSILQIGQLRCSMSHGSMQDLWNTCLQHKHNRFQCTRYTGSVCTIFANWVSLLSKFPPKFRFVLFIGELHRRTKVLCSGLHFGAQMQSTSK